MSILALIPMRPGQPPRLTHDALSMASLMATKCSEVDLVVDRRPKPGANAGFRERQSPLAMLRNDLVDDYVLESQHSHVLWIDGDVIEYPVDLPRKLLAVSETRIVAPVALMAGRKDRFYDTAGFIEHHRRARLHRPWFAQPGPIVELDSVGMCYIVPASVYREQGARHFPVSGFTEHYSVCQAADEPPLCDTRIAAYNADLEHYGERRH